MSKVHERESVMEFTFENHGTNTYLVYSVKPEDTVDTMSLGMLTHNKIPGLASTQFAQMDANKFIKYNISARVSVRQFLEGIVNKARLIGVFKGIVTGLLSAEEYMIDPRSVVIDLDYMFVDVSSYQTALICLPLLNVEDTDINLGAMFKNIIFQTQFDQSENCDYIAKLLNYLNRPAQFVLTEFRDILNGIEQGSVVGTGTGMPLERQTPPASAQPTVQPHYVTSAQVVKPATTPVYGSPSGGTSGNKQPLTYGGAPVPPKSAPMVANMVPPVASTMVPPKKTGTDKSQQNQEQKPQEEKISFLYLMQHYNKENAAVYKAQKEARKAANAKGKEKKVKGKGKAMPTEGFGYAVPPQEGPTGGPVSVQSSIPTPTAMSSTVATRPVQPTISQPQPVPAPQAVPQTSGAFQTAQGAGEVYGTVKPQNGMNFGETTVLMGGAVGETTVLGATSGAAPMIAPHLIRRKNNEKVSLNKPVFRIGKEKSYVDYFIGDNTAISRSHANIITRDGQYLVVDTNSTNHTFVNGMMIPSNQEVQINQGDVIRLANEDFEFHLY